MAVEQIDYFVVDTLSNDLEDLESILRILNSESEIGWRDQNPRGFTQAGVVPSLLRLINRGWVEACTYDEATASLVGVGLGVVPGVHFNDVWFRMTTRGRVAVNTWHPPPLPDS